MNAVDAAMQEARTEERSYSEGDQLISLKSLMKRLEEGVTLEFEVNRMEPLFPTKES